jgi:hypothetical protein
MQCHLSGFQCIITLTDELAFPLEQFGFRPGHRSTDAIHALIQGERKAFDSVSHQLLFHKLYTLFMLLRLLHHVSWLI